MINLETIESVVCEFYCLKPGELHHDTREHWISQPRQMAMALARKWLNLTYAEIGEYFAHRSAFTAMYAHSKADARLKTKDRPFVRAWTALNRMLESENSTQNTK